MNHIDTMKLALEANKALRDWVNSVPQNTLLPAMLGIDGDWLDEVQAALTKAIEEAESDPKQRKLTYFEDKKAQPAQPQGVKFNEGFWQAQEALAEQPAQRKPPYGWVRMNPGFNSGVFHLGTECPPGWVGGAVAVQRIKENT